MCTVTFVPAKDGYYLTSNRDESPVRGNVEWPFRKDFQDYCLYYPKDVLGSGTWIAADNRNNIVCLLNGAFYPHTHKPKYRMSRGLIVLEVFAFKSAEEFYQSFDLEGIEPFTLILIINGTLSEFRWDGSLKYLINLSMDHPHIWSSVTLYDPDVSKLRESWFNEWSISTREFNRKSIELFHRSEKSDKKESNIMMKRKLVQTLSITSVYSSKNEISEVYYDLANNDSSEILIKSTP